MSQIALGQRMNVLVSDIRGSYCRSKATSFFSSKMSTVRFLWVLFNCHCYDYKFWKCLSAEACFIPTELLCNT